MPGHGTIQARDATTEKPAFLKGDHYTVLSAVHAAESEGDALAAAAGFFKVKAGIAIGEVTATGEFRPTTQTRINGGGQGPAVSFIVDSTENFRVGDNVDVGADANRWVTAITSATVLAISGANISPADNALVIGRDGAQVAVGIVLYSITTARNIDHTNEDVNHVQVGVAYITQGIVVRGGLPASNDTDIEADLTGISFVDR